MGVYDLHNCHMTIIQSKINKKTVAENYSLINNNVHVRNHVAVKPMSGNTTLEKLNISVYRLGAAFRHT